VGFACTFSSSLPSLPYFTISTSRMGGFDSLQDTAATSDLVEVWGKVTYWSDRIVTKCESEFHDMLAKRCREGYSVKVGRRADSLIWEYSIILLNVPSDARAFVVEYCCSLSDHGVSVNSVVVGDEGNTMTNLSGVGHVLW
jgi:hypothetical protein